MMEDKKVKCPVCEEMFEFDPDLEVGNTMYCPGCYTDLKVVKLNPIQVEEVKEVSDDYYEENGSEDELND